MQETTFLKLNTYEGSDIFDPLMVENVNSNKIDEFASSISQSVSQQGAHQQEQDATANQIETRVGQAETNIDTMQSSIGTIEANVSLQTNQINSLSNAVTVAHTMAESAQTDATEAKMTAESAQTEIEKVKFGTIHLGMSSENPNPTITVTGDNRPYPVMGETVISLNETIPADAIIQIVSGSPVSLYINNEYIRMSPLYAVVNPTDNSKILLTYLLSTGMQSGTAIIATDFFDLKYVVKDDAN